MACQCVNGYSGANCATQDTMTAPSPTTAAAQTPTSAPAASPTSTTSAPTSTPTKATAPSPTSTTSAPTPTPVPVPTQDEVKSFTSKVTTNVALSGFTVASFGTTAQLAVRKATSLR